MATSKSAAAALAALAALAAAGAGWFLLRPAGPGGGTGPDAPAAGPEGGGREGRGDAGGPGRAGPPAGGSGGAAHPGEDEEREPDLDAPVGGASAEDILHYAARGNWLEVERLLSIAGSDDPRVTQLLLDAMKDGELRNRAAALAKYLKDPAALARFLELARSSADDNTRSAALQASAWIGGPGVYDAAAGLLRESRPGGILFSSAAGALGTLGTPEAARTLVDLLRTTAGTPSHPMIVQALSRVANPEALAEMGRLAQDEGQDGRLRETLLAALGQTKNPAVVPFLMTAAREDPDETIRNAAYAGLAAVGEPVAVQELINVVQGADDGRKAAAAAALQQVRSRSSGPLLEQALAGPLPEALRPHLIEALGWCGGASSTEPLGRVLTEKGEDNERLRVVAVRALGRIGDPSAGKVIVDALEAAPKGEAGFRHEAAGALVNTATVEEMPRIRRMFEGMHPEKDPDWFILNTILKRLEAEKKAAEGK